MFKSAASILASFLSGASFLVPRPAITLGRKSSGLRKTGKLYPHSSTRQRARYARQNAARSA